MVGLLTLVGGSAAGATNGFDAKGVRQLLQERLAAWRLTGRRSRAKQHLLTHQQEQEEVGPERGPSR